LIALWPVSVILKTKFQAGRNFSENAPIIFILGYFIYFIDCFWVFDTFENYPIETAQLQCSQQFLFNVIFIKILLSFFPRIKGIL
jgi:hypothetical protein